MAKDDGAKAAKARDEGAATDPDEDELEGDDALEADEADEDEAGEGPDADEVERAKQRPRAPRRPTQRTGPPSRDLGEVTALGAFTTFFVFSSLILAPVLGLLLYFMRTSESVISVFETAEGTFLGGIGIGLLAALVASVVFTYKAVQHS